MGDTAFYAKRRSADHGHETWTNSSECCEPTAEERSAVNPHATFCGSGRRATASRDPVLGVKFPGPTRQGCLQTRRCHPDSISAYPRARRRHQIPIALAASPYPTPRDFVPWRFLDAGSLPLWRARNCRRPKTSTIPDIAAAIERVESFRPVWFWLAASASIGHVQDSASYTIPARRQPLMGELARLSV